MTTHLFCALLICSFYNCAKGRYYIYCILKCTTIAIAAELFNYNLSIIIQFYRFFVFVIIVKLLFRLVGLSNFV